LVLLLLGAEAHTVSNTISVMSGVRNSVSPFRFLFNKTTKSSKKQDLAKFVNVDARYSASDDTIGWRPKVLIFAQVICLVASLGALTGLASSKQGDFFTGFICCMIVMTSLTLTRIDNMQLLNSVSTTLNLVFYPLAFINLLNSAHDLSDESNRIIFQTTLVQIIAAVFATMLGSNSDSFRKRPKTRVVMMALTIVCAILITLGTVVISVKAFREGQITGQNATDVSLFVRSLVAALSACFAILSHDYALIVSILLAAGMCLSDILMRTLKYQGVTSSLVGMSFVICTLCLLVLCAMLFLAGMFKEPRPAVGKFEKAQLQVAREIQQQDKDARRARMLELSQARAAAQARSPMKAES